MSLLSTGNRELLIGIKQNYSLSSIIEVISHRVLYICAECVFVWHLIPPLIMKSCLLFTHMHLGLALVHHWTMRYKAKHSYFKRLSQSLGNFINLLYTLALRHQQYHCYLHTNTEEFPGWVDEIETGPGWL